MRRTEEPERSESPDHLRLRPGPLASCFARRRRPAVLRCANQMRHNREEHHRHYQTDSMKTVESRN